MARRRIPTEEGAFNGWYANFNNNLASVAAQVGVSPTDVARVANDSPAYAYMILRNNVIRSYKDEESEIKKQAFDGDVNGGQLTLPTIALPAVPDALKINSGIEEFVNLLVQRIVKHPNCTPEIEALLNIALPDEADAPDDLLKPVIKEIQAVIGAVKIKCSMQGQKAYRVFSQRGANENFESVGDSSQVDFEDERPNLVAGQPEKRQYKLIFLEKNKPVGEYSATETVVTQP